MNLTEYNFPLIIPGGFFNGRVPLATPHTFPSHYELDYLRYLYYLCIMNTEGDFPIEMSYQELIIGFENKNDNCKKKINKILIGEAPSPNYENYFYNVNSPWNTISGNPSSGQGWTSSIKNALFPKRKFSTKISFLVACAKSGFLLLDLFPYNISYSNLRSRKSYIDACKSAFGGGDPYPLNIINTLTKIKCCIKSEISIAFAMKSFGEIILTDKICVENITNWLTANRITLISCSSIDDLRLIPIKDSSKFLCVCGRRYLFSPCSNLLITAGIR